MCKEIKIFSLKIFFHNLILYLNYKKKPILFILLVDIFSNFLITNVKNQEKLKFS